MKRRRLFTWTITPEQADRQAQEARRDGWADVAVELRGVTWYVVGVPPLKPRKVKA